MINLIVSILVAAGIWFCCVSLLFDSVWAGILPALIAFFIALVLLNRHTGKKIQAILQASQEEVQELSKIQSPETLKRMMPKIMDKAIEILNRGYKYEHFMFSVTQTLNGQIGSLYYIQKRFDDAEPYLKNSLILNGAAQSMYACILYKKHDLESMKKQFEKTLKFTRKDPLLYHIYAWCLEQEKDTDGAIAVLNQCLLFNPKSEVTKENLNRLKTRQTLQMSSFGEQWYQYMLEQPSAQAVQSMAQARRMASPFARRVRK